MINPQKLKPLYGWILVQDVKPAEKTAGGIFIPKPKENAKKESLTPCRVLAISPDVPSLRKEDGFEINYAVGDLVVHNSKLGIPVDVNDEDSPLMLKHDSVCGIIDESEEG